MHDGGFCDTPRGPRVLRVEDPRGGAPGHEPNVLFSLYRDASAASRKRAFPGDCGGQAGRRNRFPILAAVLGLDQLELAIDGIANGDAVVAIPKSHAVE